ncbi:Hemopexin-like domain-containing protein [Cercophora newfieldiana]|uniref:Hemopexin-like domain-containing protein n=1 Tax=Cercophora newfieldiana TaxID=92897 RepID=A0AA39YUM8_9PEZI|nr:Hemopexin-like domain-containing protein [Cercophora newfieldiana]
MRACFLIPSTSPTEAYFFSGARYARISFTPSSSSDTITFGPTKFAPNWNSLVKAGFESIDAVLPVPGTANGTTIESYFFSGTRYVRIKVIPSSNDDVIVFGPKKITDEWKCLAAAKFDCVDAAMPVPGLDQEAYFFRGENYVRVNVARDEIVFGPAKIADHWPSLVKAGFDVVDAVLPIPNKGFESQAYFFRGDRYARIKVVPSEKTDEITFGPALIVDEWKSLAWDW